MFGLLLFLDVVPFRRRLYSCDLLADFIPNRVVSLVDISSPVATFGVDHRVGFFANTFLSHAVRLYPKSQSESVLKFNFGEVSSSHLDRFSIQLVTSVF